ncbi:MAG: UDP-N-acetylmuramate--L-alanine ligase [Bacteroidales bacterium]|jgi:UDP-N-acetylmuramate--alanine ligase|nr:UDP-N-acetylmuramate--L-alanine ligase [Bacteroidales bacterium]
MKELENIKKIYFLGIGGIGMSALARLYRQAGFAVAGYDRTESALTRQLTEEGIDVHYDDMGEAIGQLVPEDESLVVFTPAVPPDMGERAFFTRQGYIMKKRAEMLGCICNTMDLCAVAGTHGKTTTATMLAHIFRSSPVNCWAFLGGISKNYGTNLLVASESSWCVVEADEFDRSFLHLTPDMAIITSMDADHLDIYGNHDAVIEAFNTFVKQIRKGGAAVIKKGLPVEPSVNPDIRFFSYSIEGDADFCAKNIKFQPDGYQFDLVHPKGRIDELKLTYPGLLNVENAVAASALALLADLDEDAVRIGLITYKGVARRFDIRYRSSNFLLIDDYAHHPKELKATIKSVRAVYPEKWLTGIFQPHLYSRTRDFADEFAAALSLLDEVVLLDIYPAREQPIPGITSAMILEKAECAAKRLVSVEQLPDAVADFKPGIVLMMGAGDIDRLVEPVKQMLIKRGNA